MLKYSEVEQTCLRQLVEQGWKVMDQANGSTVPVFQTDDDRLSYLVRLPVHPLAEHAQEEADQVTMKVTTEVIPEVTPEVQRVAKALTQEQSRQELQQALELKDPDHFRMAYLRPALESGLVEMTQPDAPKSPSQRYRLTIKGQQWLVSQGQKP